MKHNRTIAASLLAVLAAMFATGGAPAHAQSSAPRGVVAVSEFERGLKRIEIEVDGVPAWVIFDTGAGITGIGPELADSIGCKPFGRLSGVRMTGEVLTAPWCGPAVIKAGGVESEDYLMYFDIASLLPTDWPHVDGIMSLNAFLDGPVTLDWPGNRIILESEASLAERVAGLVSAPLHIQREVAGYSVSVFLEVAAEPAPLRVLLDAGSVGANILAPSSFTQLGLTVPSPATETAYGETITADLTVAGVPVKDVRLQSQDIIYDGTFGAQFLSQNVVTLDIASGQVWIAPR